MKSSRQPYQAPELIILGLSVKDNSNPTLKAHNNLEFSIFSAGTWGHFGPLGRQPTAHRNSVTHTIS